MNVVQQVDAAKEYNAQPNKAIWNRRCALTLRLPTTRCCDGCASYALEVIRDFFAVYKLDGYI